MLSIHIAEIMPSSQNIWEKASEDLGELDDQVERGEFAPLREWLDENMHSQGRKYPPQELLRRATGSTMETPYALLPPPGR